MRKRIVPATRPHERTPEGDWLDLESLAEVELTSEDPAYPIENALVTEGSAGWRAADPGVQTIRVAFTDPQRIQRIWLEFVEPITERTQQIVLRWSADNSEDTLQEVVRQQWNFNPHDATSETEDYHVDLTNVSVIELTITPDISGGAARASLAQLRLA